MWYIVQVKSGEELNVKLLLEKMSSPDSLSGIFVPLYEEVRRSGGKCTISFKKLFPGYIFVESSTPQKVFDILRKIPEFTKLLGSVGADGSKIFIPVEKDDEQFLNSLFYDGIMHVSYIHMASNGRIDMVRGPLDGYQTHIVKLELRHRMAIVEAYIFGKKRRIRFGLWTDDDPRIPWIERVKSEDPYADRDISIGEKGQYDIGIYPGDRIVDETGIYGDQVFTVSTVDARRRVVVSNFEIMGMTARIELNADEVKKV